MPVSAVPDTVHCWAGGLHARLCHALLGSICRGFVVQLVVTTDNKSNQWSLSIFLHYTHSRVYRPTTINANKSSHVSVDKVTTDNKSLYSTYAIQLYKVSETVRKRYCLYQVGKLQ